MKGVAEFPVCVYERPGNANDKEPVSVTPAFKSSFPEATFTYRGTVCRFSGRRCEVTTISSNCPLSSSVAEPPVGSAPTMGGTNDFCTFSLQEPFSYL